MTQHCRIGDPFLAQRRLRQRLPALALAAALLVPVAGCRPASSPDPSPQTSARPRVALIMKSLANEFFSTMAAGAEQHQRDHASDYDLLVNGLKNESDLAEQVNLIEQMVARGVEAIVIAPADSKALIPALKRARDAGVVVVNIDNKLDAEVLEQAGLEAPFVGPDNREGARQVGDALAAQLARGAQVAIIEGLTTAFNGQQRLKGFEDAMNAAGMSIVGVQSGQWEMDRANAIAATLLNEYPDLAAILCANDSMALGAVAAVTAAGRTGAVRVVGFDHIAAIRPMLADGRVTATADQHADLLAVYGIELALEILDGEATPQDRTTPVDLIVRAGG